MDYNGTRFYYKENSEKLAVFYHGNAGSACDRVYMKRFFDEHNYSFIIVEYAGYSNDKRTPSKELILKDVENVNQFISTLDCSKLIIFGESVGGGVASYHASISKTDEIILIAPFKSMAEFAKSQYPIYPVRLLLTENYPNDEWLKNYKGKVVIIHGTEDGIIPMWQSKRLYESITTEKEYIGIEGAGHNNIFKFEKTEVSINRILD